MKQTTASFQRVQALFHEALEAPETERAALIDARCEGDRELAAEVWSLLGACEAEQQGVPEEEESQDTGIGTASEARQIGPYLLDRLLGRGGMGAVYLAHRADGNFEQQVAIKLIDLPLATSLFRERFRQERQILAGLRHPYIASLLDGGVSATGDLYLAMEYVDGMPIDRFCASKGFNVTQRLELFLRVCEAVQFAHRNLVVHRDLKPDNILVAEDSTPRLLDFGTAKLMAPTSGESGTDLTREGYHAFTPQYASPEQVLGHPITTASDTYSLGVLLYVLLSGSAPYELKELTTAEMLRVICEEPPKMPAHAVGELKRLDPDLEAILAKALRKEPEQRYLTVEQFSGDVRAYLDSKPVAARRGTFRYRAFKFMRRHKVGLAATVLLLASLAAGGVGIMWQAGVANRERHKAEARAADLRQLNNSLLSELDEAIKQLPGSTGVQKLLVTRVLEHLDRMAADAHGDRLTQLDLVDAYTRLGNIQGNPYDQNLGDAEGGLASLHKARDLAEHLAAANPNDTQSLRALATVRQSQSEILFGLGRTQEAVASLRAAVEAYDKLITPRDTPPALICEVASAYGALGDELGQSGTASLADTTGAVAAFRKSIELDERALSIDPHFLRALRGIGIDQMKIGSVEMDADPAQALKDFQLALQRTDALPKSEQSSLAATRLRSLLLRKQANSRVELREYAEAFPLFHQAHEFYQQISAEDPKDLRALSDYEVILDDEAVAYETAVDPVVGMSPSDTSLRRHNLEAARGLLQQIVAIMETMAKSAPENEGSKLGLADAQVRLATAQIELHEPGDAASLAGTGLATLRDMASDKDASPMTLDETALAFLRAEPASLRDPAFAATCAERAVNLSHRHKPTLLLALAQASRAGGNMEKSRAAAKEGLALLPAWQPGTVKPNVRVLLEVQIR
ncbi:MAG TPA: protein kinase [Acidobacteriaceae bacterium]|jgi:tetratricopeptide (TPR) repeat protein